jgi:hypothetical protein
MVIRSVGRTGDSSRFFLNSRVNRDDRENFTVTFTRPVMDLFIARGVSDLKAHFEHKKIRVTGTITLYQNRPQIVLADPSQIELIGG